VDDTVDAADDAVNDTVGSTSGSGDGGGGLTDTVGSAVDTVGAAADAANDTVSSTTDTASKTAEEATTAVQATVKETTEAVQETVSKTAEAAKEAVKPVADPIGNALSAKPADRVGETVVQPVAETALRTDPRQESPVVDAVVPDSGTVPSPGLAADPTSPMLPTEVAQAAIAQPEPPTDVFVTPLSETPEATALPDGLTYVVQGLGSSEVQAAGVAGLIAAGAITIARGGFSPTSSMMFTNIRLLPAFVNSTIQRSGVTEIAGLPRAAGGAVAEIVPRRILPTAGSITEPIRDGFQRVRRDPVEYDNGDGRLLMQVGVALGTLYAAFLTVWFWATRLRWNGGWRAGV
jgi:ElaB/YqjD/DUF883 family membrane-anchored ribosome-binding protein